METALKTAAEIFGIKHANDENYGGLILNKDAMPSHHVILLPETRVLDWDAAHEWAKKEGANVFNRQEGHLLQANLGHLFEKRWYWLEEQYSAYLAWTQHFDDGCQDGAGKDGKTRVRLVRRLPFIHS
ncbi:hypothetical protein LMG7143_01653 [Ralstonia thomasii]|uniref:DUF1566 domain-containing protein n=1 Tax=Ralstonia thomasii TaxID=3058596 RepID=UPI0028F5AFBE|nr:DUF1566 domain-containing protein [Ralstonia sp. LMG 18095]CAJ0710622.1 hypothetical protein LMG7143_01653 [Ralstonia sp. LMG 18095]